MKKNSKSLSLFMIAAAITSEASALDWVETYDGSSTLGASGTIVFDDWGFVGPSGRNAKDFDPINGFGTNPLDPAGGIGQIQHVITTGPDGLTPDAPSDLLGDLSAGGPYPNANMDSGVNFYLWGYTTRPGSTFNNMQIDYDGDYHIPQADMTFEFYDGLFYEQVGTTGGLPDGEYPTKLAFQPYALSDAKGWCGSILTSHPNAHEAMAGQVTFDFAFDVYFVLAPGFYVYSNTEIVSGFEMRSYGDISVNILTSGGDLQSFSARAVVNNTHPLSGNTSVDENTPVADLSWHNKVSFMGAGILENGSAESGYTGDCGVLSSDWLAGLRGPGVYKYESLIKGVANASECSAAGGTWQGHAYTGYAFILRADGERHIDYFDEAVYGPDPMTLDTDADAVLDFMDNCTAADNASQQDTDGDNYGNACDGDFNNDGFVNSLDIGPFKSMFFTAGDSAADHNGDGIVNSLDLGLFKSMFFQAPGPSGTTP